MTTKIFASQKGYVLLVALILMGLIGIIGASSLSLAGIDHRIAHHNQKYMMLVNTSHAGGQHARLQLATVDDADLPQGENWDSIDTGNWVTMASAESEFGGTAFDQNMGVYWVDPVFEKCGNPPPGYSTEQGNTGFRSDYWEMWSSARQFEDMAMTDETNETVITSTQSLRKIMSGACKFR
ncbi:MAG: hypothetical protein GY913_12235 [Proteobacteria bacterium]|nr:hypothetical protein [Pseudomonadota bacterium]MCP4917684.1 hypothetical protein [Pseudomonadota bacterium]